MIIPTNICESTLIKLFLNHSVVLQKILVLLSIQLLLFRKATQRCSLTSRYLVERLVVLLSVFRGTLGMLSCLSSNLTFEKHWVISIQLLLYVCSMLLARVFALTNLHEIRNSPFNGIKPDNQPTMTESATQMLVNPEDGSSNAGNGFLSILLLSIREFSSLKPPPLVVNRLKISLPD